MNPGAEAGAIPEKVSVMVRAIVTAGLAKLVDEVNQYAAVMYPPTAKATRSALLERTVPKTMTSNRSGTFVRRDGGRVEAEHQVRRDRPSQTTKDLCRGQHGRSPGVDHPQGTFGERHHGIERCRNRLERQDQCDEGGTGGEAVLQKLQSDVVR